MGVKGRHFINREWVQECRSDPSPASGPEAGLSSLSEVDSGASRWALARLPGAPFLVEPSVPRAPPPSPIAIH